MFAATTAAAGVADVVDVADGVILLSLADRGPSRQGLQGQGLIPVELSTQRCSRQKRL